MAQKPALLDVNDSGELTVLNGEQLKSGQKYLLKQSLNSDIIAGDVLKVFVNGTITTFSHTVTAAEVASKSLAFQVDASMWSVTSGASINGVDYKLSTRFYTASGIAGAESRDYNVKLDNVANTPAVTWTVDTKATDNISSNATGVHVVLLDGVADHVAFVGAGAAERVVASTGVGDDREQVRTSGRQQLCSGREEIGRAHV